MFILYAIPVGLMVGLLLGGRLSGLADVHVRWSWVIVAGLLVQVALFSVPVSDRIGSSGPPIYVASTAAVLAAILANRAIRGMIVVAAGAACNLAAILANGGYMPADPDAIGTLGTAHLTGYSNSSLLADPVLGPLTDIFVMPAWMPFANVFSAGDVIIGLGVTIVIASAMRARTRSPLPPEVPSMAA